MADAVDTFKDLELELIAFEDYITKAPTGPAIILAVKSLRGLQVPIDLLLDQLISLMTKLRTAVNAIDLTNLDLPNIKAFATHVNNLLLAAQVLLPPAEGAEIQKALAAADALKGLGALAGGVKDSIVNHLGIIINRLGDIKTAP
jgi:hypothetical protein